MRDMIKMVIVLTLLSSVSGGLLAAIRNGTQDRIANQQLEFVKGPAIRAILQGAENDPISDRFTIETDGLEKTVFVGVFDGEPKKIALETYGKGYGGDIGVMVGINTEEERLAGVGVTTHAETPGLGSLAKDDPAFAAQFSGLPADQPVKVTQDGGSVNAISGATITSRAVTSAATKATDVYGRLKPQIMEKLSDYK
ncbi:MAG: RnfABCDGE type electron transport complex subunit G [Desulfobacterales bacterium]